MHISLSIILDNSVKAEQHRVTRLRAAIGIN